MTKIKKANNDLEMLDPDARFLLANERTLLAWVRTSLALIAGGIAFMYFNDGSLTAEIVGLMVVALGGLMAFVGLQRFKHADKAIRAGNLPDTGKGPALQVYGVILFTIALIIIELVKD